MTVYGNLAYALKIRESFQRKKIDERVHKVAKTLEIEHLLDRKARLPFPEDRSSAWPSEAPLSVSRKLFLMDEPLSNPGRQAESSDACGNWQSFMKELETTIIYVTP